MRVDFRYVAGFVSAALLSSLVACSADSNEPGSSGSGSGAASGAGATTGTGGTTSTGSGVGGSSTGSGGTSATGSGGSTSAGGSTATGAGGASNAGSGGAGGGTGGSGGGAEPAFSFTFDADVQGFTILTGEGASTPAELQDNAVASWAEASGDPAPGALTLDVPFDAASQNVAVSLAFATPLDLTGKTITARVRLVSGLTEDGENPGGVMLFVKGGTDWKLAQSAWHNAGVAEAGA